MILYRDKQEILFSKFKFLVVDVRIANPAKERDNILDKDFVIFWEGGRCNPRNNWSQGKSRLTGFRKNMNFKKCAVIINKSWNSFYQLFFISEHFHPIRFISSVSYIYIYIYKSVPRMETQTTSTL